ncbi:MAG: FMN-binding protein [Firmicutes bacterium]|jgi:major membrane immunogen (membrane-anchored lipoprotein)|nr:FMN-binding protein [Bacillota bacterium]
MRRTIIAAIALVAIVGIALVLNMSQNRKMDWQDGTYVGESERDERDQYGRIEIEIKDGKIVEANYSEIDSSGNPKGAEYPYQPAVESMPEYEKQLMDKQDVKKVEIISGATTTGEKFKDAATNALEKAAKK